MKSLKNLITVEDVRSYLPLKTWWAMLLVLPMSERVVCFFVNCTSCSPNTITFMGMFLRLFTAFMFLWNTPVSLSLGAASYLAAYVCDCTDGAVARLTEQSTELGRYLDHLSDLIGDIVILLALAWSQDLTTSTWIWAMAFMHIAECYMSYLSGFALSSHQGGLGHVFLIKKYNHYRSWFFERNIKSFFSFPDYTAFVFVLCPILGIPDVGLRYGFYFLLVISLYTVLSTFVSIHSDESRFP